MSGGTGSSSTLSGVTGQGSASTSHRSMNIKDERAFHRAFDELCIHKRQSHPQRLLSRFLRYHTHITKLASALDESSGLDLNESPSSILWSKADEAVKKTLGKSRKQYDRLTSGYLPPLSDVLPAFGAELSLYPNVKAVQKPLQDMFKIYIKCYDLMLLQPGSEQEAAQHLDSFREQTKSAKKEVLSRQEEWMELVQKEKQAQVAPAEINSTADSRYDTSQGPYDPGAFEVRFERQKILGSGTYGTVYKVCERSTGTLYAQKTVKTSDRRTEEILRQEFRIMQMLRHHHIASVHFGHLGESGSYSFLMLPVADWDLGKFMSDFVQGHSPGTSKKVHLTYWFGCLISALSFAHSQDIRHGDIKPGNILIKETQPYLTDFGSAEDPSNLDTLSSERVRAPGTKMYSPPDDSWSLKADVFSLGCVFSEMLTVRQGRTPEEFRRYRCLENCDYPYAFRENLNVVTQWLNNVTHEANDLERLLKEQTLRMLEPRVGMRAKAKDVKKALRAEEEMVFCNSCN